MYLEIPLTPLQYDGKDQKLLNYCLIHQMTQNNWGKKNGILIPVMLDTKGPEIRTHLFEGGCASINTDDIIRISMKEVLGNNHKFSVTFPNLINDVKIGDRIRLDDGNLTLLITDIDKENNEIVTKALNHHVIKDRRGVNFLNKVLYAN